MVVAVAASAAPSRRSSRTVSGASASSPPLSSSSSPLSSLRYEPRRLTRPAGEPWASSSAMRLAVLNRNCRNRERKRRRRRSDCSSGPSPSITSFFDRTLLRLPSRLLLPSSLPSFFPSPLALPLPTPPSLSTRLSLPHRNPTDVRAAPPRRPGSRQGAQDQPAALRRLLRRREGRAVRAARPGQPQVKKKR